MMDGISSHEGMYSGPTHMAIDYSNTVFPSIGIGPKS